MVSVRVPSYLDGLKKKMTQREDKDNNRIFENMDVLNESFRLCCKCLMKFRGVDFFIRNISRMFTEISMKIS
jgi:hypothetical protein